MANRTIVLSQRSVRLLRFVISRTGIILGGILVVLFVFFAVQAARVPMLTGRLAVMEQDAKRLDTLQLALAQMQKRYAQVQTMLGANPAPRADTVPLTVPDRYPLDSRGFVTRGIGSNGSNDAAHPGLDIAVTSGTEVRAAGGGVVVEVGENAEYGRMVRLSHAGGYETLYGHLSDVLVKQGERVASGAVFALSGNTGRSTAPHLHFEVRRNGSAIDPMQLIQQKRQ